MNKFLKPFALALCFLTRIACPSSAPVKFISHTDTGRGTPIILIHAFPSDHRLWQPQQDLAKQFRVITLDLRGFGQSEKTDGQAVLMSDYADEVKQLMDQLKIKKAIIGGESMGGYISLAFLKKYPDHVSGLILSNTQAIADSEEAKPKREANAKDILQQGNAKFIEGFMPKVFASDATEQQKNELRAILEAQSATGMASALRGMALRKDTTAVLAKSKVPVLIITGDQDAVVPMKQSEDMQKLANNSRLVVIKNAGHLTNFEKPEEWNHAVVEMFHHK